MLTFGDELATANAFTIAQCLAEVPVSQLIGAGWSDEPNFPVSNDEGLGQAYNLAAKKLPAAAEGKVPIALIIGNGSIETAAQILPQKVAILHCDVNPRTLFTLRVVKELIANCEDRDSFAEQLSGVHEQMQAMFTDSPVYLFRNDMYRKPLYRKYQEQRRSWEQGCGEHPDHFLQSERGYKSARAALGCRAIGYRLVDLEYDEDIKDLERAIDNVGGEIVLANFTNVFADIYAGRRGARRVGESLPFHPRAVIIDSHRDAHTTGRGLLSAVSDLVGWQRTNNVGEPVSWEARQISLIETTDSTHNI